MQWVNPNSSIMKVIVFIQNLCSGVSLMDFTDLTSRSYINCELQKPPQFGGDMCSCVTAFKSDAQTKLHQTETREDLF